MSQDSNATRRVVLRRGLSTVAGVVAATAAIGSARAQEKLAKEAVQYQDQPKDGQKCSLCVNFAPPNACNIVAGNINPEGWCVAFGPKNG